MENSDNKDKSSRRPINENYEQRRDPNKLLIEPATPHPDAPKSNDKPGNGQK